MKRIQRQRTKGWRMPTGAIYVGRPSPWGNPFAWNDDRAVWMALAVGEDASVEGKRAAAVKLYRWWISGADPKVVPLATDDGGGSEIEYSDGTVRSISSIVSGMGAMMWLKEPVTIPPQPDIGPLGGKDLVCWCPLDQPCHADVLLELAS
ncbi:MAG: DUF4326 domain-containing protein [Chloroflexi bacterium]|nr:DUF4326 domain-containing protein [Chloroflexota bacterium]